MKTQVSRNFSIFGIKSFPLSPTSFHFLSPVVLDNIYASKHGYNTYYGLSFSKGRSIYYEIDKVSVFKTPFIFQKKIYFQMEEVSHLMEEVPMVADLCLSIFRYKGLTESVEKEITYFQTEEVAFTIGPHRG